LVDLEIKEGYVTDFKTEKGKVYAIVPLGENKTVLH
jgi:hypothetical protein